MSLQPLTARQARVFDFILEVTEKNGYAPSIREIADEMGFTSPNGVTGHLKALERKGYIERTSNKSRSIVPTEEFREGRAGMPLSGVVSAGSFMQAYEQEERIDIGDWWTGKGNYALLVEGESMIEAHIQSGDYVIVQRKRTASKGDIVVAKTGDGEATLKYWFPEKNRIRLQPANKKLKPIYSKDAKVIGVVVGVVRQI